MRFEMDRIIANTRLAVIPIIVRFPYNGAIMIILFNKPYRVMCQFTDDSGRATLADYINVANVYPAGRLDFESEGLMVLTDDGRQQHRISHPRHKLDKTYWVQVEGNPSAAELKTLCKGITLKDGPAKAVSAKVIAEPQIWPRNPPIRERQSIPTSWLAITLNEGRNRQIRRMTAAIGFPTLRLIRCKIGDWDLGELAPGEWREVT